VACACHYGKFFHLFAESTQTLVYGRELHGSARTLCDETRDVRNLKVPTVAYNTNSVPLFSWDRPGYTHATLSTVHIMSMSSTKHLLVDWITVSSAVLT